MGDFFKGMCYVLLGMSHLFKSGFKRFILLPILFNIVVFFISFFLIYHYILAYSHYYIDKFPSWLSFLNGIITVLVIISFLFLFFSMFTVLFNLFAAPFYGLLAEKAQNRLYLEPIPSLTVSQLIARTIKRQIKFLIYFLPRFLGMILLFFIPFVHPFYPFLWFMFTAWIFSMQCQDSVMDNNLISFNQMKSLLKEHSMLSLGFGFSINFLLCIPLVNLIVLPGAVIGGVMLYCEEYKHKKLLGLIYNSSSQ